MRNIKFISITLLVCLLSCSLTYAITENILKRSKSEPINAQTKIQDLYKSELTLTQNHKKCGHTVSNTDLGIISYSSPDELLQRYPGYKITSGEGEKIVLTADVDTYCHNHFFAQLVDSEIIISRLTDNKTTAVIKTDILSLSEQEKKLLTEGITLNSAEALTSFIEDFTS